MCQHHTATDIADSENMRHGSPHIRVRYNALRRELDARVSKVQCIYGRTTSHSHQDIVRQDFALLVLFKECNLETFFSLLNGLNLGSSFNIDSTFAECLFQPLGHIRIETRKDILAILKHGHFGTEAAEY